MKQAYKKKYDYQHPERYRRFLKQHLLVLTPIYYAVVAQRQLDTPDGMMWALSLKHHSIDDPTLELAAECWLNGEYIYLWQNWCWGIAVNDRGHPILQYHNNIIDSVLSPWHQSSVDDDDFTTIHQPCNKALVIYQLGIME